MSETSQDRAAQEQAALNAAEENQPAAHTATPQPPPPDPNPEPSGSAVSLVPERPQYPTLAPFEAMDVTGMQSKLKEYTAATQNAPRYTEQ